MFYLFWLVVESAEWSVVTFQPNEGVLVFPVGCWKCRAQSGPNEGVSLFLVVVAFCKVPDVDV